jgi:hypothetical protein
MRRLTTLVSTALAGATLLGSLATSASAGTTREVHTRGWFNGLTLRFSYTHTPFCANPPTSAAKSHCEAGAANRITPSSTHDPVWVLVPVGFHPPAGTLQCSFAGHCADHPATIDLSRVHGARNAAFPVHSLLIDDRHSDKPEWWDVRLVWVRSSASWNALAAGKSIATLRQLQHTRGSGVSKDIATNTWLFFYSEKGHL